MRILIAEDERDLNKILAQRLIAEHYSVDSCFDGQEALDYLEGAPYDAVVLDIMMPVLDGLGALKKIIAYDENAHAVMVTAAGQKNKMVDAIKLGANEFVQKPFEPDQILSVIGNITK